MLYKSIQTNAFQNLIVISTWKIIKGLTSFCVLVLILVFPLINSCYSNDSSLALKMQVACTIHTTTKKMKMTQIFAFSYQISWALFKSVNIALLLFQIAMIPLTSPVNSQSTVTKHYLILMYSPIFLMPFLASMFQFHLPQALAVKQQW